MDLFPKNVPFARCIRLLFVVASTGPGTAGQSPPFQSLPRGVPLRLGTAARALCPHRSAAFLESALELQHRFPLLTARKLITASSLFKRKWKQPSHWSLWYLNNCTAVLWAGFTTLGKMLQSIPFECRSSLFNIKCVYVDLPKSSCFKWTSLFIQNMQLIEVVLEICQSL